MSNEDLLRAGIAASKAGNLDAAAAIFARLVKADPGSEQGWLWLGQCCPSRDQSIYCFRRVLVINPNNLEARQRLDGLLNPSTATPSATPVQSEGAVMAPKPVPPAAPSVSPFFGFEQASTPEEHPAPGPGVKPPFEQGAFAEQKPQPAPPSNIPSFIDDGEKPAAQPKRTNKLLTLFLWALPVCLLLGLVMEYLYLTGMIARWLPAGLLPGNNPTPAGVQVPIQVNTNTPLPTKKSAGTLTVTPTLFPTPMPTFVYAPVWTETECTFAVPSGVRVNCGFVSLPEDRTNPHSEKVKLAVAVFHSWAAHPAPDPVIFLQGGPGGAAVEMIAGAFDFIVEPFLSERDFIVFDQRGTGLSKPALECKELTTAFSQDIRGQIPKSSRNLIYSNAFISCHGKMRIEGVNLNAYTTEASAADVKDILTILGYQKVNLYGASYGTRLAQVVMRDYPEIVRSSVVDSVVPIEAKLFNEDPAAFDGALQALFDSCAADAKCHAAYPNLETDFWQLVNQLDSKPVSVTAPVFSGGTITEDVDGSTLMSVIILGLLKSSLIAPTAQSIYQIKSGDYSTLIGAQSSLPWEFEGLSPGLYVSMMCHEHLLATSADQLAVDISNHHGIGDFARLPFFGDVDDLFKTCKSWGTVPPAPDENDPVSSDIPTLVIAGKFDPVTPPAWGKQLASHLKHAYFLEFPAYGHCPTAVDGSMCALNTVVAFVHDPSQAPDHSCLDKMEGVQFTVPYTGNPGVKLDTVVMPFSGISIKAPVEWPNYSLFGIGDYWRNESSLDITQMVIAETPMGKDEWLDWLSSKLYGYQGFDGAPVASGVREVNGLTWNLYKISSYGRPVDLAMADIGDTGESLVVLLFCHTDEHEAFYQTLFLPVLDSATPKQ